MGFLTDDVTTKLGDKSATVAEARTKRNFAQLTTRLARRVEAEGGGDPYKTQKVTELMLEHLDGDGAIFAIGSSSPKELGTKPIDTDPLAGLTDGQRELLAAYEDEPAKWTNDGGEPAQVKTYRKEVDDLNDKLDDLERKLTGGSLIHDASLDARIARLSKAIDDLGNESKTAKAAAATNLDDIGAKVGVKRNRNEADDAYRSRLETKVDEIKATTASGGTTVDTSKVAKALGLKADATIDEIEAAAASAQNWAKDAVLIESAVKSVTDLDLNDDEKKPGGYVKYVTRGLEHGPKKTGLLRGRGRGRGSK